MRNLFVFWILLISAPLSASPYSAEIESLLCKLDSLVARKNEFVAAKEEKIDQLRRQRKNVRTLEEQYWLNKMFYDEYFVYNADSAMFYVDKNLSIACEIDRREWQAEWKIKKSFLLAATGLLKEALDELQGVSGQLLAPELKVEYYGQMMYLYSHFGQYSGNDNMGNLREGYYQKEGAYKDSIYATITSQDPFYLWYKGWKFLGTSESGPVKKELLEEVAASRLETRRDAMNAYILACLYREGGQQDAYLKYMALSAWQMCVQPTRTLLLWRSWQRHCSNWGILIVLISILIIVFRMLSSIAIVCVWLAFRKCRMLFIRPIWNVTGCRKHACMCF